MKVYHGSLNGQECVVKPIHTKDQTKWLSFLWEAKIVGAVQCQNIGRYLGFCKCKEGVLLLIEHIQGKLPDAIFWYKLAITDLCWKSFKIQYAVQYNLRQLEGWVPTMNKWVSIQMEMCACWQLVFEDQVKLYSKGHTWLLWNAWIWDFRKLPLPPQHTLTWSLLSHLYINNSLSRWCLSLTDELVLAN